MPDNIPHQLQYTGEEVDQLFDEVAKNAKIWTNKQNKLSGKQGQMVGFDSSGNAVAQSAPETGVVSFNGRKGDVVARIGDYTVSQIVGAASSNDLDALASTVSNIENEVDIHTVRIEQLENSDANLGGRLSAVEIANDSLADRVDSVEDVNDVLISRADAAEKIDKNLTNRITSVEQVVSDATDLKTLHFEIDSEDGHLYVSPSTAGPSTGEGGGIVIPEVDIPTKTSDLINDSGFVTIKEVNSAINSKGFVTSSEMNTAISDAIADIDISGGVEVEAPTKTSELTNDSGFVTTSEVDAIIDSKGYTTFGAVNAIIKDSGFVTNEEMNTAINDALADFDVGGGDNNPAADTSQIGSIKFSASEDVDSNWLLCDGSFISESEYPELVAALGKKYPSNDKFKMISSGEIGTKITNGVIFNGRMWVYSYTDKKLYGVDILGSRAIKTISVTSTSPYFASFIEPTDANPLCLSIVPHPSASGLTAKLFLAQILADNRVTSPTTEYSFVNSFLIFSGEFTGDGSSVAVEPPFTKISRESSYYTPYFYSSIYVPCVVSKMKSGVETYYCAACDNYYVSSGATSNVGTLYWSDGTDSATLSTVTNSFDSNKSARYYQRLCYNHKNKDELVRVYTYYNSPFTYYCAQSYPDDVFTSSTAYQGTFTARSGYLPINIAGNARVLSSFDLDSFPQIPFYENSYATVKPNLLLPSAARIFVDAGAYLWNKDMFMIFVGTGIIFSRDLSEGSFGYLDTTEVLGTITQFGYLEYSEDDNMVVIVGQDSTNKVVVGKMVLDTLFDYSNDGTWLPQISSDGIPAYIRAKKDTTE